VFCRLYYPEVPYSPDGPTCIVKYQRIRLPLNPTFSPGFKPRTTSGFVTLEPALPLPNQQILPRCLSSIVVSSQDTGTILLRDSNPGHFRCCTLYFCVTVGKFDKCLHVLSIFLSRKVTVSLIIRHVSLNTVEIIPEPNIFTEN
jgi:hypothetical protein